MIYVECWADEVVVRALGIPRAQLWHRPSKGAVVNAVRRSEGDTGIVDEDPGDPQPTDLKNYVESERLETLRLLCHKQAPGKRMVLICPYLEAWMLRRAQKNRIDVAQFGLPTDPHRLHETPAYEEKPSFRRMLDELIKKDAEIRRLSAWLHQAP